jgi:hypothetical protein
MAADKGAPSRRKSPKAATAGIETAGIHSLHQDPAPQTARAGDTRGPQRSGRRLSPSEHAMLTAMIAEAEAMRRRLTATD